MRIMKFLKLLPIFFIFLGNFPSRNLVHAEIKNPEDFRVLSNESKKLSISNVKYFIKEGVLYIKNGDFEKALLQTLNSKGSSIITSITKDKALTEKSEKDLQKIIEDLLSSFE